MSENIVCFRCGASLSTLSLPLSRRDQCPECSADDRSVPRQCREDGAEDVTEKERVNFCDWFKPSSQAFEPHRKSEADAAQNALAALFGEDGHGGD